MDGEVYGHDAQVNEARAERCNVHRKSGRTTWGSENNDAAHYDYGLDHAGGQTDHLAAATGTPS